MDAVERRERIDRESIDVMLAEQVALTLVERGDRALERDAKRRRILLLPWRELGIVGDRRHRLQCIIADRDRTAPAELQHRLAQRDRTQPTAEVTSAAVVSDAGDTVRAD